MITLGYDLAKRLRYLRDKHGYAQKYVANQLGIKNNTLSGYESGRRMPDAEMINKIADFYGCSTDYLLGRVDDPDLYSSREEVERTIRKKGLLFDGKDLSQLSEKDRKLIEEMIERLLNEN